MYKLQKLQTQTNLHKSFDVYPRYMCLARYGRACTQLLNTLVLVGSIKLQTQTYTRALTCILVTCAWHDMDEPALNCSTHKYLLVQLIYKHNQTHDVQTTKATNTNLHKSFDVSILVTYAWHDMDKPALNCSTH